jgi:hypothetical protein
VIGCHGHMRLNRFLADPCTPDFSALCNQPPLTFHLRSHRFSSQLYGFCFRSPPKYLQDTIRSSTARYSNQADTHPLCTTSNLCCTRGQQFRKKRHIRRRVCLGIANCPHTASSCKTLFGDTLACISRDKPPSEAVREGFVREATS